MSNNLENETSLYLKEYIKTPINWYPYGAVAFEKARREKRPIFISIGYSGSYWCDVMKEESFMNETIAKLLNENFISIKVDKDERTDVDKYYKQVYRLMNGQTCASPLCVFLTENQQPFYSTAYIAPIPRGNVLGFEELLHVVIEKYQNDKPTMIAKGEEVLNYLNPKNHTIEATRLHIDILNTIKKHTNELIDKEHGGFGKEPKFLNISTLDLLLKSYQLTQDEKLLSYLIFTINKMIEGEIYDSKNGGFYRYANTESWRFPRLEKMSYDNAEMTTLLLQLYQQTGNQNYYQVALKTLDFLLNQMYDGDYFFSNMVEKEQQTLSIDTKVVTSFNAMVIDALLLASSFEKRYLNIALNSLDKLLNQFYIDKKLYHTHNIHAFLEDYAYLGKALLHTYRVTQDKKYLQLTEEVINQAIEYFYEYGKWKFSKGDLLLYDDIYDPLYPSAISTILMVLHQLSFKIESDYNPLVFKTLELHSYNLMRQPLSSPKMTKVLLLHLKKMI